MMTSLDMTASVATMSSILLFLTGIPICRKIIRKGNTTDVAFVPFLIMFCSSSLWFKYGLLKNDQTLIIVNGVGAVLTLIYIGLYYSYTIQKGHIHRQMAFGGALLFPMLIYLRYYADDRDVALFRLGSYCCFMGVLSYGSPLASVSEVIRSKSTECMAFPLSLGNLIVSIEWVLYGYLLNDVFIQAPNFIGFLLGLLQMALFIKYPTTSQRIVTHK